MPRVFCRVGDWLLQPQAAIAMKRVTSTLGLLPSLLTTATPLAAEAFQQRGKAIAERMCAQCHAIGRTGDSAHAAAPPFRVLQNQIDISQFAQRLRSGLLTGHDDMPMFRFDRESADAIVAYIRSVQAP
jgi:cytochrome c